MKFDNDMLQAALEGLTIRRQEVEARIADIRQRLGGGPTVRREPYAKKTHKISPEGRAHIAAAQRKRWAAVAAAK